MGVQIIEFYLHKIDKIDKIDKIKVAGAKPSY